MKTYFPLTIVELRSMTWSKIKYAWSKGGALTPLELLCHLIKRIRSKACASTVLDPLLRMSHNNEVCMVKTQKTSKFMALTCENIYYLLKTK
ncbi:hypothetical protein EJB05_34084, partial [Eragrostis curvula]